MFKLFHPIKFFFKDSKSSKNHFSKIILAICFILTIGYVYSCKPQYDRKTVIAAMQRMKPALVQLKAALEENNSSGMNAAFETISGNLKLLKQVYPQYGKKEVWDEMHEKIILLCKYGMNYCQESNFILLKKLVWDLEQSIIISHHEFNQAGK